MIIRTVVGVMFPGKNLQKFMGQTGQLLLIANTYQSHVTQNLLCAQRFVQDSYNKMVRVFWVWAMWHEFDYVLHLIYDHIRVVA